MKPEKNKKYKICYIHELDHDRNFKGEAFCLNDIPELWPDGQVVYLFEFKDGNLVDETYFSEEDIICEVK